jgi:predicted CXXCH cytochrome family protein
MECTKCHNVHFIKKDKKYCASCHGNIKHALLPSEAKHLSALSCIACHGKPDKTNLTITVNISNKKGIKASQIDSDSNRFITSSEWHAFEDLLHRNYRDFFQIQKVFKIEGDSHTISNKPAPCTTCHSPATGYFPTAILQVTGTSNITLPIDASIFVPELPSRNEFSKTVHGRKGVVCTDCHKSQDKMAEVWSINAAVCVKCHKKVQEIYKTTTHSKKGATHCVDCHNPHRIKSYKELNAGERVAVCTRCHKNYLQKHSWLPNATLHFEYLECAACHSPRSEKSIVYYFNRKVGSTEVPLSFNQLTTLFGSDPTKDITEYKGILSPDMQIGRLFSTLAEQDKDLFIDASIIVTRAYHDYSETRLKEKECVTCHSGEARFYDSMYFILPGKSAPTYIPVRGTLIAAYPIGGFVDFFLLGENKIRKSDLKILLGRGALHGERYSSGALSKLIDLAGLSFIVLIIFGISAHIILRFMRKR